MNQVLCSLLAVAVGLAAAPDANAGSGGRKNKDEKKKQKEARKDEKRQQQAQRQAERRDRDCAKDVGPGAVWSAAQNKCLPPKTETPKKEVAKGATLPKGGAAPAKAESPKPRGAGESCGMVGNTMMSCRAPYVCTAGRCAAPAAAELSALGGKCGPSGGRFIRCAAALKCDPKTNTCVAATTTPATPKPQPVTPAAGNVKTVGERAICGKDIKDNAGKLWRFDCKAGLECKPMPNFPGRGTCQKPEAAKAEEKKETPQTKGAPPIVGVDSPKEYGQCSLVVNFSAPADAKEVKLYYARPGSPPYNREWDEKSRWRDETSITVGGGSSDCGGVFKFKLCASYKVTDYQDEERCTSVQTKQAPPKE